jgi:hypothetical protein
MVAFSGEFPQGLKPAFFMALEVLSLWRAWLKPCSFTEIFSANVGRLSSKSYSSQKDSSRNY